MSKDINRSEVLQNIRVRSTLKKDGSWIQRSNDAKKEQDTAGTNTDVETKSIPARSSQVRLAARRFEAIDPPPSSPLQKAEVISSEGNSANQASAENISAPKDTRPEGSTVKIEPQPPTKAPIQNINAQPEKTFTEATAENTEQHADAPADTCHNEDKASADADVKNPPAEISAAEGTVRESSESKSTAGVSGESVIKTEPPNTTNLEHAGVNMYGPPALATSGKEASLQGGVETPAVSDATPEEETALQNSTISVTDTLPAPSSQSDADTAKGVEFKVECAPPSEPVFKSGTEEAVEREDEGTVVEQSFDPTPKTAADCDKELNIEDALDQVAASDAEGVLDNTEHAAIRLTDASAVETAKAEAVPKPVEDPRQPHSEDFKPNQKCDDSHISDVSQKPAEDVNSTKTLNKPIHGKSPCYFCNQIINGNVKIMFSEPSINCHPDCLKCGVCARALGDMLTPMFLKDQVIQCGVCFSEAVKK
ncbi:zinc finger protein 185 isoform X2 [Haplochromis burtoni]|uniref:zinc finger protein 185 isoform X2 n=1 Tax=Haplochromis burtoni TaxID=8153 RepID=UPI0003BD0022|nr:zinc finger protein 185 isoform X2 [Haplochromis burtoni]